ncbi:MAG TPA: TspO/MBR family protein [Herpetosiphonaceae bacterium]|nr:TspO/MBR family protein [Herpetosiphonaceae bacterium]
MTLTETIKEALGDGKRWRWYHGAAFMAGAQAAAFGLEGAVAWATGKRRRFELFSDDQVKYYHELKQAVFTPPPWAFGPAWITNNILTVASNLRVLNKPADLDGRATYLALQAASWLVFVSFNAAYVGLRSPMNAFGLTFSMWALTVASTLVALRDLKDTRAAWLLATLLAWTTLASAVAVCQALWNHDDFYNVGPLAEPSPALVK